MLVSVNPATEEVIARYRTHTEPELDAIVINAHRQQAEWSRRSVSSRAEVLREVARVLRVDAEPLAETMAHEMGKPIRHGRAEVEKCAWVCDHYAEHATELLAPEPIESDAGESYTCCDPLGVVLAVMPWNFPYWQVMRAAAPSLAVGNGVVLKHATNVTGCALALERIMLEAGVPEGLFATVVCDHDAVASLIEHPEIAAVTLTGSRRAGRAVAGAAGRALKKCVLELGGSDAYVVLEDADPEQAARICASSRMTNGGQSCIAAKRMIVVEPQREAFVDALVAAMQATEIGDPLHERTEVGPLARRDVRDTLYGQLRASLDLGAKLACGGEPGPRRGVWFPPTVLTDVSPAMAVFREETFGPVAAVVDARDEIEAIRLANDSSFGLGAAVFTGDLERGERIARRHLEAGSCFVNAAVRSDPRLPFGGIRDSGFGRELGTAGLRELVNLKTVWIAEPSA